uniref:Enzymatic polyprotein n=1 Tax=Cacopsylla melanoneura TaxID=428564 RepID=A0A8D9E8A0_9HEMI
MLTSGVPFRQPRNKDLFPSRRRGGENNFSAPKILQNVRLKVLREPLPRKECVQGVKSPPSDFDMLGYGGPKGGQLKNFVDQWKMLGAPPQLIPLLQGYSIPFSKEPPFQRLVPPFSRLAITPPSPPMDGEILSLLESGMIVPSREKSGFISPMFLVTKPDGSQRPVFNLKGLNTFLSLKKFRLISHLKVPSFLQRGDFLTKLDLSQAYSHVPIVPRHQRFLSFVYRDKVYQWTCLPFGLASAPQAFAQLTNWVASLLREKGVRVIVYLDDFLVAHQDPATLTVQTELAVQLLSCLGWTVNLKKSQLVPSQSLEFLGITWDMQSHKMCLPPKKVASFTNRVLLLIQSPLWSLKTAQELIGILNFAAFVVPLGRLHLRRIQLASRKLNRLHPYQLVSIPQQALREIEWWGENLSLSSSIHLPLNRVFMSTDASDEAWGAEVMGMYCQGNWSQEQRLWHINKKELFAVRAAIFTNSAVLRNCTIVLQTDNRTVAAYIRKQGGLRSVTLLRETEKLLNLISPWNTHILPFFIPGKLNTTADSLSRGLSPPDWHLSPSIILPIFQRWGVPEIDLFATNRSKVVDRYVSRDPRDPLAVFIDAFSRPWMYNLAWVFPPPPLMPQVLHHLNTASGRYIIVAPRWPKVFWRADLKARTIAPPLVLPELKGHLTDLSSNRPPPQIAELTLEIWLIQGGANKSKNGLKVTGSY